MIPLILRLKKTMHKQIALAQDYIIEELYKVFNNAVLHGGTAIWRCYKGNRFSEDIDAYLPNDTEKVNIFFENLKKRGFIVTKKKITKNSIYSEMTFNRNFVRFEALFKKITGVLREYETVEDNFITIYTLSAEELISEKTAAYLNRLKVRDLYDIFFLLRYVTEKEKIMKSLAMLAKEFKMPVDSSDLKILILEGLVPTPEKMIEYIKSWAG